MAEITRAVTVATDDAGRIKRPADYFSTAGAMGCGHRLVGEDHWDYGCGMRFLNMTIPKGSTVNSAKITLIALSSLAGAVCNARLHGEKAANPVTFVDLADFDGRARTTASVDWDAIAAWTEDDSKDSPDITSIIEEIIAQGGWASGQAIVIFLDDFDKRSNQGADAYRLGNSFDHDNAKAPVLYLNYNPPREGGMPGLSIGAMAEVIGVA